ncbi:hypothetical protein HDK77DRAFT_36922 [Phyllosticta capitalensis]
MLLRYYAAWSSLLSVVQWWCCTKLLHSPILSCLPACLPVRTPSNIQKKSPIRCVKVCLYLFWRLAAFRLWRWRCFSRRGGIIPLQRLD